ncbi:hypothetical protein TNCV_4874001 [Trichonephila clavipes]|nr:hypothetical protein TNCV_4874001 [Trichonephila clavipes]
MSTTSPFAIHKALIGIGGEPKPVKKLRSGDLIETSSAVQTKSFLLAKSFLDSPTNITAAVAEWYRYRTVACFVTGQQPSQTFAQAVKSISVNNYTQIDENITKIKCPPLQLLPPLSSVPQLNASPSIPSVSTSSSTTQANILPSATSIKPTTQIQSRLPEPISTAAAPDISLFSQPHPYQLKHTQLLQLLISLPHFNHQSPY